MTKIELPRRKTYGHLTLLREPRRIGLQEFNALDFTERLDIVRQTPGTGKYELLLEARDGEQLVAALAAQELYLLVKEVGREDVAELMAWVTPEQFTTFLDLDAWEIDRLDGPAVLHWLQLLLDAGEEKVLAMAHRLDFPMLVLLVKKFVHISHGPEDFPDDDQGARAAAGYEVEYLDAEGGKVVGAVLDVLHRLDPEWTLGLLRAVRWEQEAQLEEEVFQARAGRLADYGFVDPVEAQSVFAWLDPDSFRPADYRKGDIPMPGEEPAPPGFVLTTAVPRNLLAEVLAEGLSQEGCWELTYLLNAVMSADHVDVGDSRQVQAALEQVYHGLNLGLEHLCGRDVGQARQLLEQVYLRALFRLGFSRTLQLQRRARALQGARLAPYLGADGTALLTALTRKKPLFLKRLANPVEAGTGVFATSRELDLSAQALQRLELQVALFDGELGFAPTAPPDLDLNGCAPAAAEDLRLADFFLTALANRVLGRSFLPQPIPATELKRLHQLVCSQGQLQPQLHQETVAWLESLLPGGGIFADECLALWAEEFCPLSPEGIDPRFLRGLIVRL